MEGKGDSWGGRKKRGAEGGAEEIVLPYALTMATAMTRASLSSMEPIDSDNPASGF
jgi:hypothetical protein